MKNLPSVLTGVAVAAIIAVCTCCCEESIDRVADRVFDTAISQYRDLDASLSEGMLPR